MAGKGTKKARKDAKTLANSNNKKSTLSIAGRNLNKHKIESHKGKGKWYVYLTKRDSHSLILRMTVSLLKSVDNILIHIYKLSERMVQ